MPITNGLLLGSLCPANSCALYALLGCARPRAAACIDFIEPRIPILQPRRLGFFAWGGAPCGLGGIAMSRRELEVGSFVHLLGLESGLLAPEATYRIEQLLTIGNVATITPVRHVNEPFARVVSERELGRT